MVVVVTVTLSLVNLSLNHSLSLCHPLSLVNLHHSVTCHTVTLCHLSLHHSVTLCHLSLCHPLSLIILSLPVLCQQLGRYSSENQLLKYSAKDYYFKGVVCHFAWKGGSVAEVCTACMLCVQYMAALCTFLCFSTKRVTIVYILILMYVNVYLPYVYLSTCMSVVDMAQDGDT